jgi:hypothetical protein
MISDAAITLLIRETGWTLEYIRGQPVSYLQSLLNEISYQKSLESYKETYNSAMVVCAFVNSKERHYKPEDIIGNAPERRTMEDILTKPPKMETITLADGKEYKLSPINLNILSEVEDKFNKCIEDLFSSPIRKNVLRALLYARIKRNHDITEEQLGELMTDDVLLNMKLGV